MELTRPIVIMKLLAVIGSLKINKKLQFLCYSARFQKNSKYLYIYIRIAVSMKEQKKEKIQNRKHVNASTAKSKSEILLIFFLFQLIFFLMHNEHYTKQKTVRKHFLA